MARGSASRRLCWRLYRNVSTILSSLTILGQAARRELPMYRLTILILILGSGLAACESSLPVFGSNVPEDTAAVLETCPGLAELGTDSDGFATRDEFRRAGAALFAAWDDTGDGLLSYDEYNDCYDDRPDNIFAALDNNSDRMISPEEFLDLFAIWDTDRDGRLGEGEVRYHDTADRPG